MNVIDSKSLRKFKKDTNFFETPQGIADRMAELMDDVGRDARILEPSAGMGALISATQRAIRYDIAPIEFCETNEAFIQNLERLGAKRAGSDFLQLPAKQEYDAIIMNPPYTNRGAEKHVDHAWNHLKPGGKMCALVGQSAAKWIDEEFSGHVFVREVFEKGFEETSITTVLFLIHKPL